jgi:hypothetical protein
MESLGTGNLSGALKARAVASALLAASMFGSRLAAQTTPQASGLSAAITTQTDTETHKRVVLAERVANFMTEYSAAAADARKRADTVIEKARPVGAGVTWYPGFDVFAHALRELRRAPDAPAVASRATRDEFDEIAAALDLIVVPGVFAPRDSGPGDALTVRVRTLYPAFATKDFVCTLEWIGPDGKAQLARREPIEAAVLRENGFEMFIHAPLSKPGWWTLRGKIGREGDATPEGLTAPTAIQCVDDFDARFKAAGEHAVADQPGRTRLLHALDLLRLHGLRSSACIGPESALFSAESWSPAGPPIGAPVPIEIAFTDGMTVDHWAWWIRPPAETARTILLLAPAAEAPDAVFAGALGAEWMRVARQHDAELYSTHLPLDATLMETLLASVRTRAKGELLVVARGDAFGRLQAALYAKHQAPPFDAIVISSYIIGQDPSSVLPGVTRLLVAPGDPKTSTDKTGTLTWIEGSWLPLLNEPRLPHLVDEWLTARDSHAVEHK